jgi:Fibronectin type III domain
MATCKNCGNTCGSQGKCGCNDTVLHLPPNCNPPACPNPEPCPETFSDCCIIHNGDSFTWLLDEPTTVAPPFFILQGERLCDTWQRFLAYYNCGEDPATVPYGLKSTSITASTITVAWTPVTAPVVSYIVKIAPVATEIFTVAGTVTPSTSPSLTITGLTANTSYYVKVIANNPPDKRCESVSLILTTKVS